LAGVDLDAATGEIVLLSGPNGAGKTTLLRLLAGLVPLYSGEASVLGVDLAVDRKSARRELALVGHETFCYDDLTVRENLRFSAKAAGRGDAEADAALERLGLARQADVAHRRLSAGQRRRLAIAVAMSRDPRLLLLDEPHAGLDAEGREVLDAVVRAAPGEGRTVLMASHELEHVRGMVTREVIITSGQVHARAEARADEVAAPGPATQEEPEPLVAGERAATAGVSPVAASERGTAS
jgi:heme ABC exporter ATP-binding subunit CcmA